MKPFIGTVISKKMDKTITVSVSSSHTHPKYKKIIKRNKKYLVHDEKNQAKLNDQVTFSQSRPISKRKKFVLNSILTKPATAKNNK